MVETWGLPGGTVEAEAGIRLALSAGEGVGMALILQVVTAVGEGWSERSFRQIRLQDKLVWESWVGDLLGLHCPPCVGRVN